MLLETFPPTRQAALARVSAVRPSDYARSRNAIEGAVTGLSPYITHGLLSLPEVLAGVTAKRSLEVQHKFVFELGWREYFRHVWGFRGEGIFESLREGLLPQGGYSALLPADIRQAATGVPVIDTAVRTLFFEQCAVVPIYRQKQIKIFKVTFNNWPSPQMEHVVSNRFGHGEQKSAYRVK